MDGDPDSVEPGTTLTAASPAVAVCSAAFSLGPDNRTSSPQCPTGLACAHAIENCGILPENVSSNEKKLNQIVALLDYESLLGKCGEDKLPGRQQMLSTGSPVTRAVPHEPWLLPPVYRDPDVQEVQQSIQQTELADQQADIAPGRPAPASAGQPLQNKWPSNRATGRAAPRNSTSVFNRPPITALNQWQDNLLTEPASDVLTPEVFVNEGIMRPLWVDRELLLVRRVESDRQTLIQGCWLDWNRIQMALPSGSERFVARRPFSATCQHGRGPAWPGDGHLAGAA